MKFFYLSSKSTPLGEFEIHERNCPRSPSLMEKSYLGPFVTSAEALKQARRFKPKAVLCPYCSNGVEPELSYSAKNEEEKS